MRRRQEGSILVAILIMMPFFMAITISYLQLSTIGFRVARSDQFHTQAQLAADAAIDFSLEKVNVDPAWAGTVNSDPSWTGPIGEIPLHNDGNIRTTYQATLTTVDPDHKTIVATGRTYHPVAATTPSSSVKVEIALRPVRSGDYSVVSGVGGLIMRNSAKVVNGNVFVNGKLTMSNTAQIGLAILPVDVTVAHQSCPTGLNPGPTYPQVCGSGNGQPISFANSAHIYGRVLANNQTSGSSMSNSGLCASTVPACASDYPISAIALPDYDRDAQKAAVPTPAADPSRNITGSAASCSLGVKTWKSNTKITGNVSLSNLCIVTVEGNIWITGNFELRNSAQLIVKPDLTEPPVIMVDGSSGFSQRNGSTLLPSLALKGFKIITYYNTTGNPDADITGTNLYNSQNVTTIDLANSASGLQTEYYARWSKVTVNNTGSVGAIAGQTVELSNTAAISLGTSVDGFGDTVWVVDGYRRVFD